MDMELHEFDDAEHDECDEMTADAERQTDEEVENSAITSRKWLYTIAVSGFYNAKVSN